jgi:short-subunit dehydrogenase
MRAGGVVDGAPVAIVTGGSAGIGLAVCKGLRARGYVVVMVARTRAVVEREAAAIGAVAWPLDVGDLEAAARLPGEVVARCGRLDVLVNNAGLHHRGPVASRTAAELAQMVAVDLTAPIVLSRAALDHLRPGGAIVQVASLAGRVPLPGAATYSGTKAGLRFFTHALADERPDLRISTVSPGPVDTGFFADELDRVADLTFSQPMSTAEQVADAVLACLDAPSREVAVPASSGRLTTLAYVLPAVQRWLRLALTRRGARNKAAYRELLASRRGPR